MGRIEREGKRKGRGKKGCRKREDKKVDKELGQCRKSGRRA